jgi:hypothetical protein
VTTTWSTTDKDAGVTLSGGNLVASFAAGGLGVRSADRVRSGKYYWEVIVTTTVNTYIGICLGTAPFNLFGFAAGYYATYVVGAGGTIYTNGTSSQGSVGGTIANGWVLCIALDMDNKIVWFRNGAAGTWDGNAAHNPATTTGGISFANYAGPVGSPAFDVYAVGTGGSGGGVLTANFGASGFVGTPPVGFTSGFPDSTTLITNELVTQVGVEQFATAIPPQMQVTQIGIEQWGPPMTTAQLTQALIEQWSGGGAQAQLSQVVLEQWTGTAVGGVQALVTQAFVEQWAKLPPSTVGGPMVTMIF